MSFRTLLAPLLGLDRDAAAMSAALTVAREFDSHVEALFTSPDPRETVPLLAEGMSGAVIEELTRAADRHIGLRRDVAREHFNAAVSRAGVALSDAPPVDEIPTARFVETLGRVDDVGVNEARLADLSVFSVFGDDDEGLGRTAIESALLASGRPILLVGGEVPAEIGRVAVVAWNGRAECARAVAFAMPFLRTAERVFVLTAETQATEPEVGERLVRFLSWHRIDADLDVLRPDGGPLAKALSERAIALGADLMVMGGFGHGRMREMILGGVTRQIVAKPRLPVLMAH